MSGQFIRYVSARPCTCQFTPTIIRQLASVRSDENVAMIQSVHGAICQWRGDTSIVTDGACSSAVTQSSSRRIVHARSSRGTSSGNHRLVLQRWRRPLATGLSACMCEVRSVARRSASGRCHIKMSPHEKSARER